MDSAASVESAEGARNADRASKDDSHIPWPAHQSGQELARLINYG